MKRTTLAALALVLSLSWAFAPTAAAQTISNIKPAAANASLTATTCVGSSISAAGCIGVNLGGWSAIAVQVTGTYSGTITFESSIAGTFYSTTLTPSTSTTASATTTSTGMFYGTAIGSFFRVRMSSYSSGTAVVNIIATLGGGAGGGGGSASSVTINDPSTTSQKMAVNASGQASVTCANCSGSGASAVDQSAFTVGAGSGAPAMGIFEASPTSVTDGKVGLFGMTTTRQMKIDLSGSASNTNAFKVNIASGGIASGGVASGAYASGAFASGAFASGSYASGAFASGALALGAIADGADVTKGAKADAKSTATDTTAITEMQVLKEISFMEQNPATRAATGTKTTNAAVPGATNLGAMPCVYNASVPSFTETFLGFLSCDLSGRTRVIADINNGSTTVTEAATITANQAGVALTNSVLFGFDGTTDSRLRTRAGLIGASDVGLVTRPFTASDGTNTAPTMDAVTRPGFVKMTDGTNTAILDPCESSGATISSVPISQTASTIVKAGTSAKKTYVCGVFVMGADAENLSLVGGTGSACATSTVALVGGTTAAAGPNGAANGGWVLPNGKVSWTNTTVNADDLCLLQSGSGRVAGVIKVAVQ